MYTHLAMASELDMIINLINEYYRLMANYLMDLLNGLGLDPFLTNLIANMIGALFFAVVAGGAWAIGKKMAARSAVATPTVKIPSRMKEPIDLATSSRGALLVERAGIETAIKRLTEFKTTGEIPNKEYTRLMSYYEDKLSKIDARLKKIEEKLELEKLKKEAEQITTPTVPSVPSVPAKTTETRPVPPTTPTKEPATFPELIESSPLIEEMIKSIDVIVKEFKKGEK